MQSNAVGMGRFTVRGGSVGGSSETIPPLEYGGQLLKKWRSGLAALFQIIINKIIVIQMTEREL